MRFIKALLILAIFLFGLLFFTQNQDVLSTPLVIQYDLFMDGFSWTGLNVPFYFVILVSFGTGALLSVLFFLLDKIRSNYSLFSRKRSIRMLEREVKRLTNECERLSKAKPLAPSAESSIDPISPNKNAAQAISKAKSTTKSTAKS